MTRVLTALLLIPLVVVVNFHAPGWLVGAVFTLVALLCLGEFFDIATRLRLQPFRVVGYGAATVLILAHELPHPAFFVTVAAVLLVLSLQPGRSLDRSLGSVSATLLGLVYIGGPFALARELHGLNPHWLFFVLVSNWVGDSAAYYVGRAIGRHRLASRISPNKTWEGTAASTFLGAGAGAAYLSYAQLNVSLFEAALLGLAVNVAGQLGDLAESGLKRSAGVKDSGSLLPGHGGILDRLDGLLFAIPAAYLMLSWL